MDEKNLPEKGLLIDRLQISDVHMECKPPNPEREAELEAKAAALQAELKINTSLPYAPDFTLDVLLRAKELLHADWETSVELWKGRLFEQMTDLRDRAITATAVTLITDQLCQAGANLRRNGVFSGAELIYRTLNQYCGDNQGICTARMRLAEMIRKKEIPSENPTADLSQLLRFPIQQGHSEAVMTLALFLAARPRSEVSLEQWLEDLQACMGVLEGDAVQDATMCWEAYAALGDPEGYLVHLLLLLFHKIDKSPLGSHEELLDHIQESLPEIAQRFTMFVIENAEGQSVECEILFTFESDKTDDVYLVYTDHTVDEEGSTKVYASIFDGQNLLPVETEAEWQIIEVHLEKLKEKYSAGAC